MRLAVGVRSVYARPVETPPKSEYKGKPTSPDTVKKTVDFKGMKIRIDRPKGFVMRGSNEEGKPWERTYKYDYGFLPRTKGGDGDGLDVFIGPDKSSDMAFWAIQKKKDGSFDEYKVFVGFPNKKSARQAYVEHIPRELLVSMAGMTVDMMKAMLNLMPDEKLASRLFFLDEFSKINGG